jgi:hypothetical protein
MATSQVELSYVESRLPVIRTLHRRQLCTGVEPMRWQVARRVAFEADVSG